MESKDILELKFYSNDLDIEITFREYFKRLLLELWNEMDNFSGKRPFGNGGWEYDLYICLIKNKIIKGTFDEDGYLKTCDNSSADIIIKKAIKAL
jgi:hypothetical protein